jgi:hypothetical protein
MKLEVSEQFVREAHKSACQDWKQRIEAEFPSLFDFKWESNKWYKLTWDNGQAIAYVNSDGTKDGCTGGTKGFGIRNGGIWDDTYNGFWGGSIDVKKELMTPQEIESMLWKEAEKRGIGKDTKLEECILYGKGKLNVWYHVEYNQVSDILFNNYGCIYNKGRWAIPLDPNKEIKETISRLEKELKELKEKVSPTQDIGW